MRSDSGFPYFVSGVIFDLDGTLVNSNQAVEQIWRNWAEQAGVNIDELLSIAHGRRPVDTLRIVAPSTYDIAHEVDILAAQELNETTGIFAVSGAKEFLSLLGDCPWAIVTSAPRKLAIHRLNLTGLKLPKYLLGAEDVVVGKPHPAGYLKAAELLAIDPAKLLIIENSTAGLAAAQASGAQVLAIGTTLRPDLGLCRDWITDFSEVTLKDCGKLGFRIDRCTGTAQ